jgi:hypothetical protein
MHDFAHGGAQGGHLGFALGEQVFVERLDMPVMSNSDKWLTCTKAPGYALILPWTSAPAPIPKCLTDIQRV